MNNDQFSLPFLDTTSLGGGFGLYDRSPTPKPTPTREGAGLFETPAPDPTASLLTQNPVPAIAAHDYQLVGDRCLAEDWKARAEDNLAAIRLMAMIESEARHARPDEQERLARFTAFGASDLADRIFRRAGDAFAPSWEDLGVDLEGLVSRDDLANLKRATQYAHYTPEFMIRAIWRTLRRMGFDGGRVLEPGCGTGLFFALCPEALVGKLALTGVEMDPTTARIAKLLYPNARISHEDFTKARLPELYDLAIGNPPNVAAIFMLRLRAMSQGISVISLAQPPHKRRATVDAYNAFRNVIKDGKDRCREGSLKPLMSTLANALAFISRSTSA
jgi:SAM-dependent methyltransferase